MNQVQVPVSPGELLDKITILQIKSERIEDRTKLLNVRKELSLLRDTWQALECADDTIDGLIAELKGVNERLWEIEDAIRDKEREGAFDREFIELARSVYFTNDRRSEIKKKINLHLGSEIVEEKSYADYGGD